MVCICDEGISIRTCGPFANRDDVMDMVSKLCQDCVGSVPLGTDPADFCTLAFGGAMDDCCEMLFVFEGTENVWYSTDCTNWVLPGCNDCVYDIDPVTYPDKTTWCAVADAAGLSTDCCHPMWFNDGSDIWWTDDCTNFYNMTQLIPPTIAASGAEVKQTIALGVNAYFAYPNLAQVTVTLEKSAMVIIDGSFHSGGNEAGRWAAFYNVTNGNYVTNWRDQGDLAGGTEARTYAYEYLPAGTYTFEMRYWITSITGSPTGYAAGFRVFSVYDI